MAENQNNKLEPAILSVPDPKTGQAIKVELPVYEGTMKRRVIDITSLHEKTGHFTFDPGFSCTAPCESKITHIDGENGILLYRGYTIEDLVENCDFMEVAYLLLEGELPNKEEKSQFDQRIKYHTLLHEQVLNFFKGFRRDAHPMAIMVGVVGALSAFYHDSLDINDPEQRELASYRLIAKVPTIAALAYKYSMGQPFSYPRNNLDFASNFLHMMFSLPTEDYQVKKVIADAMDRLMILHADHSQNASTSTVRLAGSSGANPFACIAAGVASLWGPAHGGANQAVLEMLNQIGSKEHINKYIKKAKDKDDPFRLMGFGHRVYKNYDPRARLVRKSAHDVLEAMGVRKHPLLDLAMELEKIALEDDYFVSHKLFPNVDFYSGIIFKAMGIPTNMFTSLFAVSRTVGWVSQWKEMIEDPKTRIGRPRQLYLGYPTRKFVPIKKRK